MEQGKDGVTSVTGIDVVEESLLYTCQACLFPGCHPLSGPPKAIHPVLERTLWVPAVKIF